MRKLLFVVLLVLTVSLELCVCNIVHPPIVIIDLSKHGFHRDLVYTVQLDYSLAGKNCEYALEQHFPAGMYISVDQLDDLKRLKKLDAAYPEFVDIEATAEKSTPFTVILKGIPKISDKIKLPVHYRYHAPSSEHDYVDVQLATPLLYIKCFGSDDEQIDAELLLTPHIRHCLEMDKPIFSTLAEKEIGMDCAWRAMKANYQIMTSLIANIPVGDSKSFPLVLYATIICSWVISLWTVFRTRAIPRSINQKLEEQRLINKKKLQ